jgi:hypothetical protein
MVMVSQKVHLRRCAATSSLRRTPKCASLLSFCTPCIWSFLRNNPFADFYGIINGIIKISGKIGSQRKENEGRK